MEESSLSLSLSLSFSTLLYSLTTWSTWNFCTSFFSARTLASSFSCWMWNCVCTKTVKQTNIKMSFSKNRLECPSVNYSVVITNFHQSAQLTEFVYNNTRVGQNTRDLYRLMIAYGVKLLVTEIRTYPCVLGLCVNYTKVRFDFTRKVLNHVWHRSCSHTHDTPDCCCYNPQCPVSKCKPYNIIGACVYQYVCSHPRICLCPCVCV